MMKVNLWKFGIILLLCLSTSVKAQKKIKVACVGNSVTYGSSLPDRERNAYPFQLQRMLGDNYEVSNFGRSGTTLLNEGHRPYTQQPEYKNALAFAADKVIIHLGLNDTDPRNWPNYNTSFIADYLALIASFREVNPDCEIWICRLSPIFSRHPRFKSGTRDWYGDIQNEIERVATYAHVGLIDFQEGLYNRPNLLADALHPNIEGAEIIARTVYSRLTGNYGGLQMPVLYTDKMVLQRNKQLELSGIANAGEKVTVSIDNKQYQARAGFDGKWDVVVSPMQAGGPYTLTISTDNRTLTYRDVLVGEVWLCSGQSNMAFMLKQAATGKKDIAHADNSNIRLFDMKPRWNTSNIEWSISALDSINVLKYYKDTRWTDCNSQTAASFSAIAYYFGKMLSDSLGVPVGLIQNAIGGSTCESWIDRRTLEYNYPDILNDWKKNDHIMEWARMRASKNIKQATNPLQRHPYEPCYLFESGIIPLAKYPVNGIVWYQGESNENNIEIHEYLFPLLVNSWRTNWNNDSLPFYYVQLSSIDRPSWPQFRDSQRRMMNKIPNIYMTVSSDKGDSLDVHPRSKKEIGERLAASALNNSFNKKNIIPSGPLFSKAELCGEAINLTFNYSEGMHTSDNKELRMFEVAEFDGIYYPAQAVIEQNRIKVWSDKVRNPRFVRYGWQPFTRANLVNTSGFPASTFKADCWADFEWNKAPKHKSLPDFPIKDGVSASFAGLSKQDLLVAGGCNFPDTPVAEGGKKVYYNEIWGMNLSANTWVKVGKLPYKVAYGASVSVEEGVVCIGGVNDKSSLRFVTLIGWDAQHKNVKLKKLPELPFAVDNGTATLVGRMIYLTGGNQAGKETNNLLCLDMDNLDKGWQLKLAYPGAQRVQPVMIAVDGKLYLAGGFQSSKENNPVLSADMLCYDPSVGKWSVENELPLDADNTPCYSVGAFGTTVAGRILLMGGVNSGIFRKTLLGDVPADYMTKSVDWYRFNPDLFSYDTKKHCWNKIGSYPCLARAGAAVVAEGNRLFVICGELKPGIRTPEVNMLEF